MKVAKHFKLKLMSKTDKQTILYHLKGLNFITVSSAIKTSFAGEVVGWNLAANSLIRKSITMDELQEEIDAHQLPLVIVDWPEYSNCFRVYLKEVV